MCLLMPRARCVYACVECLLGKWFVDGAVKYFSNNYEIRRAAKDPSLAHTAKRAELLGYIYIYDDVAHILRQ